MTDELDLTFPAPHRPLSENDARGRHWSVVRRDLEPWRLNAWAAARNARVARLWPEYEPHTVQVVLPFRDRRRRDPHNYTSTVVKAIVDGLVQAGLTPDDTPEWITVLDPELVIVPKGEPMTATVRIRPRETP